MKFKTKENKKKYPKNESEDKDNSVNIISHIPVKYNFKYQTFNTESTNIQKNM